MLKRIRELRNVGRFQNCRAGGVQFGRFTIIHGRNTYGKSTLGDIFSSLAKGENSRITGRASIPNDGVPQCVCFSVQAPGSHAESEVRFEGGTWTQNLPPEIGIKVFDDGFLHDNLFAARAVTRETQENFSAYVLGAQGVQQAKQIAEKRRTRQQLTRDRNTLERDAFSDIEDIPGFVALVHEGTNETAEARLQAVQAERAAIEQQRSDMHAIHERPEGTQLHLTDDFSQCISTINEILPMGLEGTHQAAKARVAEHIANHFSEPQGAERWIREGLNQNKGEACQFCGQVLSKDATALLGIYHQAFDEEFDRHEGMVKTRMKEALRGFPFDRADSIRATIGQNAAVLAKYPELKGKAEFDAALRQVEEAATDIETALAQWGEQTTAGRTALRAACEEKLLSPHASMPLVDAQVEIALETTLLGNANRYNQAFNLCLQQIQEFKRSSNPAEIGARATELLETEKQAAINLKRINLDAQCTRHAAMTAEMRALDDEIPRLDERLREDQSEYLERFFDSLNRYFSMFGSRNFTLERAEINRGHIPIYFLRVKYHGVPINERDLDRVFSESDRRALALAVFWAQLQELPAAEKARQIVVLDDPLTSFDDSRISAVHDELVQALDDVLQIIVLSHYSQEIRSFLETYKETEGLRLLCLESNGTSSILATTDPEKFIRSEHEKQRIALTAFADGTTNDCEYSSLRVFFEQEFNYRFAKQLSEHGLDGQTLNEKIEGLADNNVISTALKTSCHRWRRKLNPAHHTWPESDLEDRRSTTRSLLDFIYNNLIPQ